MAAMASERSRSLHNFSLPPRLNWGAQRHLRCSKINPTADDEHDDDRRHHGHDGSSSSTRIRRRDPAELPERKRRSFHEKPNNQPSSPSTAATGRSFGFGRGGGRGDEEGIEVVREKLMIDLQMEVDKMKIAILGQGGREVDIQNQNHHHRPSSPQENGHNTVAAAVREPKPWNLRTRRSAFKEPCSNGNGSGGMGRNLKAEEGRYRSPRPVPAAIDGEGVAGAVDGSYLAGGSGGERRDRAKFSVSLARQEIEEDFMELTGRRPARKPRKRPKYVQKQLDTLFPGLWLSEITADLYKVNENAEPGKGL